MSDNTARRHTIRRTSPKGEKFVGTCILCGEQNLKLADAHKECPNQRALTEGGALIEVLEQPN